MIMGILTVLWEKWVEFRRDFYKITLAAMIAPLLYILVFGLGIQTMSHGQSYLNFLIPGVVALTTMNGSFNAIAQNLNVQRLYEKAFDQVMISPTPLWQFIAGQVWRKSRGLLPESLSFTGASYRNRTLLQWLVLPSDVFKRSSLLHHRSSSLLLR
ncbi:MAG: ABC transporter permease [Clostridia bacterium]